MDSNNNNNIKSPRNNFPSPRHSHSSSSSSSNSNNNNNNNNNVLNPPKPITRSEPGNPYPTTFVQADPSSFKQVVQMLTGSTETSSKHVSSNNSNSNSNNNIRNHIPPIKTIPPKKQQSGFKLYERRNSLKNLHLNPLLPVFSSNSTNPSGFSPRNTEILSPSILDFPALVLSPVTPLIPDPFNRTTTGNGSPKPLLNTEAEEIAIREKGFFLHPSPSTTPRDIEPPRLLPLFPTTSPKASSGPSSSST
ncbi:VQ motif-containing protein [Trifolium repens]|nr:VQ motif-containing protein [Trifolium repens]